MECKEIIFSGHAIQRMFERGITTHDVRNTIESGEIIAEYPQDQPYPTFLMLGTEAKNPVHVVLAVDKKTQKCYVIASYNPDPSLWSEDFKRRR